MYFHISRDKQKQVTFGNLEIFFFKEITLLKSFKPGLIKPAELTQNLKRKTIWNYDIENHTENLE